MYDFIRLVLSILKVGVFRGAVAMAIAGGLLWVFWVRRRSRDGSAHPFPWRKVTLCVLAVGYLTVVMYITVHRYTGGSSGVNVHLFRAWREAWNQATVTAVLNPVLNALMFLPLGVLFPLGSRRFHKWVWMLLAAFACSLFLETAQYLKGCGVFDVDDLLCNTLGAMLGYCLTMAVMSIFDGRKRRGLRFFSYLVLPILTCGVVGGVFLCYAMQPYGNLSIAPSVRIDTSKVEFRREFSLEEGANREWILKAPALNIEACDAFAAAFAQRLGITFERTDYYDKATWFMNQGEPFYLLKVNRLDGSYEYSTDRDPDAGPAEGDQGVIRQALEVFGITIPDSAVFGYSNSGWHTFQVERTMQDEHVVEGTLRCQYTETGIIRKIENHIVIYAVSAEVDILSPSQAYEALCQGYFTSTAGFEDLSQETVQVLSCELNYRLDSKGFYQPVYQFELRSGAYGETVEIPAMAR